MIGNIVGNKTLGSLFEERVGLFGDKPFLVFESKDGVVTEHSYDEMNRRVNRLAHGLKRLGVRKQDKVVVHLSNCPEFVVAWFALSKIGAILVPTNTYSTADELEYVVAFSDATVIITEPVFVEIVRSIRGHCEKVRDVIVCRGLFAKQAGFVDIEEVYDARVDNPGDDVSPTDVGEILFTSGTTARPKGALLTHEGMVYQAIATGTHLWFSPNDRVIIFLPLFHVNAQLLTLIPTMAFGGTAILLEEYSATKFMRQIREHRATFTCIVPTILRTLLKQPKDEKDKAHFLRTSFYALPTSKEEWEEFETRFNIRLMDGYGLTETYPLAISNPYWGLRKRHCIGLPMIGFDVRLVDDEGNTILEPNRPGEILLRGKPIFAGYYKNEEETRKALDKDGWLHTGDIAYMDSDGYYYFYDRKKEIVKRAGENVSTSEVERVLNDHEEILESAVVGVPDKMRDEAVFAFVVAKNCTLTTDEIRTYCRSKMSEFKVPQYIKFIDRFERTSIGKIRKPIYKELAKTLYVSMAS